MSNSKISIRFFVTTAKCKPSIFQKTPAFLLVINQLIVNKLIGFYFVK